MEKRPFKLPQDIYDLIRDNSEPVRGLDPLEVIKHTRFYVVPPQMEKFYQTFKAHIWGGCFKKNEITVDPDYVPLLESQPESYADEIWHELVHNCQRWDEGENVFNFRYAMEFIFKAGFIDARWRKISYEKEAFAQQARFRARMGW